MKHAVMTINTAAIEREPLADYLKTIQHEPPCPMQQALAALHARYGMSSLKPQERSANTLH